MKLLFDFLPVLLFFISFKIYGIYVATGVAMAASVLQVTGFWLKHRRFEALHIITLVIVLLLGSVTLLLHNPLFIKWKPTVIYWAFAIVFLSSQFMGKKPLFQRMMEEKLELTPKLWARLNISWVVFFALMGIINLVVAYHFSTDIWVDFKLFGTLGLTVAFVVAEAVYMAKHDQSRSLNPLKKPRELK
jgi:intracellular septation protein